MPQERGATVTTELVPPSLGEQVDELEQRLKAAEAELSYIRGTLAVNFATFEGQPRNRNTPDVWPIEELREKKVSVAVIDVIEALLKAVR